MKLNAAKISQYIFLTIFLILFINTEYRGKDEISLAINSFFRANTLVIISYFLSNLSVSLVFLPGFILMLATAVLGRFFCGWICPLGSILDLLSAKIKKHNKNNIINTNFKYFLLIMLLVTAALNINLSGLLDPIAILVRFFTFSVYPLIGYFTGRGWAELYKLVGEKRDYLEPIYMFIKNHFLPFRTSFYPLAFFSLLFFAFIIFLERYEKRNWCKNLCPLGTLLGILSSFSMFKRVPVKLCSDCKDCKNICPTAFDSEVLNQTNCIVCMECQLKCKYKRASFKLNYPVPHYKGLNYRRRELFTGLIGGVILTKMFNFHSENKKIRLLRPPGVSDEDDFLKKCVRCGECIKICLRNALYPAVFDAGFYGIATPQLIPRKGYCEYNCTLCGQVCPTKAIPELPVAEKQKEVIGVAVFDKNHCLPYAKKMNCIVCEEHCPVPEKAIKTEVVKELDSNGNVVILKRPYVIEKLCIGCGICEYICPLSKAGVEIFTKKDERKV